MALENLESVFSDITSNQIPPGRGSGGQSDDTSPVSVTPNNPLEGSVFDNLISSLSDITQNELTDYGGPYGQGIHGGLTSTFPSLPHREHSQFGDVPHNLSSDNTSVAETITFGNPNTTDYSLGTGIFSGANTFEELSKPTRQRQITYETDESTGLKTKLPFDIDNTDKTNHGPAGVGKGKFNADLPFDPTHYRNTFISIVMGAFPFDTSGYHLHSSTFNPMYCGHPIIQFAPYKSLETMKQYGFKTFDKWWDESYDDEPDDWKRLQMIMDLVLKLSNYDEKDLLHMYQDMKETLQHNIDIIENYDIKTNLYDRIF